MLLPSCPKNIPHFKSDPKIIISLLSLWFSLNTHTAIAASKNDARFKSDSKIIILRLLVKIRDTLFSLNTHLDRDEGGGCALVLLAIEEGDLERRHAFRVNLESISPTFYKQLLRQFPFAKKMQT